VNRDSEASIAARGDELERLFLSGQTLQSAGEQFGLTRERVRQILVSRGVRTSDGGSAIARPLKRVAADAKKAAKEAVKLAEKEHALNARCEAILGCPLAVARRINAPYSTTPSNRCCGPVGKFCNIRNLYRSKHQEWALSLVGWHYLWVESGHWVMPSLENPGGPEHGYGLARIDVNKAFCLGNLKVVKNGSWLLPRKSNAAKSK
jgi:hypothetical protein